MRLVLLSLFCASSCFGAASIVRSTRSGPWSAGSTWEGGAVPGAGSTVLVRAGHSITYDILAKQAVRAVHIAGTLTFATAQDTCLEAGLIRVQMDEE